MKYAWNIDETQSDDLQVTIMIHDGDIDEPSTEYIGELTIFFKDEDEIWEFLEQGLAEWRSHHKIMERLRGSASTLKTEEKDG